MEGNLFVELNEEEGSNDGSWKRLIELLLPHEEVWPQILPAVVDAIQTMEEAHNKWTIVYDLLDDVIAKKNVAGRNSLYSSDPVNVIESESTTYVTPKKRIKKVNHENYPGWSENKTGENEKAKSKKKKKRKDKDKVWNHDEGSIFNNVLTTSDNSNLPTSLPVLPIYANNVEGDDASINNRNFNLFQFSKTPTISEKSCSMNGILSSPHAEATMNFSNDIKFSPATMYGSECSQLCTPLDRDIDIMTNISIGPVKMESGLNTPPSTVYNKCSGVHSLSPRSELISPSLYKSPNLDQMSSDSKVHLRVIPSARLVKKSEDNVEKNDEDSLLKFDDHNSDSGVNQMEYALESSTIATNGRDEWKLTFEFKIKPRAKQGIRVSEIAKGIRKSVNHDRFYIEQFKRNNNSATGVIVFGRANDADFFSRKSFKVRGKTPTITWINQNSTVPLMSVEVSPPFRGFPSFPRGRGQRRRHMDKSTKWFQPCHEN